jgi:hypothetical protein
MDGKLPGTMMISAFTGCVEKLTHRVIARQVIDFRNFECLVIGLFRLTHSKRVAFIIKCDCWLCATVRKIFQGCDGSKSNDFADTEDTKYLLFALIAGGNGPENMMGRKCKDCIKKLPFSFYRYETTDTVCIFFYDLSGGLQ